MCVCVCVCVCVGGWVGVSVGVYVWVCGCVCECVGGRVVGVLHNNVICNSNKKIICLSYHHFMYQYIF